ncbi:MAG: hypothetical protein H6791_01775 [Candidatus Nomurabacteria bacterium]|nr:MAG: hypothetical protein H6791_01775 [Candidatus Nomurabacteria bacterium]
MAKYFTTDGGNFFVRARAGNEEIFFFINPKNGKLLDQQMEFHYRDFYFRCKEEWGKKEAELPKENLGHIRKIVQYYLGKKRSPIPRATIGDVLKNSGIDLKKKTS